MAKDTGWNNRNFFEKKRFEIFPHNVVASSPRWNMKTDQYLFCNEDVKISGVNPVWHALMHGVYEGRDLGKQSLKWKFVNYLLKPKLSRKKFFPSTSITSKPSFVTTYLASKKIGRFKFAYEYMWGDQPFCLHLGHGGKNSDNKDVARLEDLLEFLVGYFQRSGELGAKK